MNKPSFLTTIAFLFIFFSQATVAATYTISTSDNPVRPGMDNQGWWNSSSANANSTNDNYITREYTGHRSYFTFDLSGVTGNVIAAELQLRRYSTSVGATLELFDVSTSAADLAQRLVMDMAIWSDLGTGSSYGQFTSGAGNSTDLMTFSLNLAALSDINAHIQNALTYFSIGGTSTNGYHFSASGEEPGNSNTNYIQQLVLTTSPSPVPVPAAVWLFGTGILGILGISRRKKIS